MRKINKIITLLTISILLIGNQIDYANDISEIPQNIDEIDNGGLVLDGTKKISVQEYVPVNSDGTEEEKGFKTNKINDIKYRWVEKNGQWKYAIDATKETDEYEDASGEKVVEYVLPEYAADGWYLIKYSSSENDYRLFYFDENGNLKTPATGQKSSSGNILKYDAEMNIKSENESSLNLEVFEDGTKWKKDDVSGKYRYYKTTTSYLVNGHAIIVTPDDDSVYDLYKFNSNGYATAQGISGSLLDVKSASANISNLRQYNTVGGDNETESNAPLTKDNMNLMTYQMGFEGDWHDEEEGTTFYLIDNRCLVGGYAIIQIFDTNSYSISKFDNDGFWEGYAYDGGISQDDQYAHKTLEELKSIDEAHKNQKARLKNPDTGEITNVSHQPVSSNENGGVNISQYGSAKEFDRYSLSIEEQNEIECGMPLEIAVGESDTNKIELFGICFDVGVQDLKNVNEYVSQEKNFDIFNSWLEKAEYDFRITTKDIAKIFNQIPFEWSKPEASSIDLEVLDSMQKRLDEKEGIKLSNIFNTILLVFGGVIILYAIVLIIAWIYDTQFSTNEDNSDMSGWYAKATFGRKCAVEDDENMSVTTDEGIKRNLNSGKKRQYVNMKEMFMISGFIALFGAIVMIPVTRTILTFVIVKAVTFINKIIVALFKID